MVACGEGSGAGSLGTCPTWSVTAPGPWEGVEGPPGKSAAGCWSAGAVGFQPLDVAVGSSSHYPLLLLAVTVVLYNNNYTQLQQNRNNNTL